MREQYDGGHERWGKSMDRPSLAEQLKRTTKELHEAEDALLATGFSQAHWSLIKKYIGYAIVQNQILALSTLDSLNITPES
jgi:hypothetical protein